MVAMRGEFQTVGPPSHESTTWTCAKIYMYTWENTKNLWGEGGEADVEEEKGREKGTRMRRKVSKEEKDRKWEGRGRKGRGEERREETHIYKERFT